VVIWFAALSVLGVSLVFDSAGIDYRLVILGSVLPAVDGVLGGPWPTHTLAACVVAMGLVMVVARGRRLVQRRWLGVPIGMFAHLVLDATWADTEVFWWPFAGVDVLGGSRVPEFSRGATGLVIEAAGVVAAVYAWRRFGLADPARRRSFLKHGRLSVEAA